MKKYRLKEEAVKFFKDEHATKIHPLEFWENIGVDMTALEEVNPCYISFGIRTNNISSSLSGWSSDEGSHFHFTIVFPNVKFSEHDKFCKGKITRELMNKIQRNIDSYYSDFINEEITD